MIAPSCPNENTTSRNATAGRADLSAVQTDDRQRLRMVLTIVGAFT